MCTRARSKEGGGGGVLEEGRLCPEPGVRFRFPPLVRRAPALWQSTRCTTKFGGLNKLGGHPLGQLGKTGQHRAKRHSPEIKERERSFRPRRAKRKSHHSPRKCEMRMMELDKSVFLSQRVGVTEKGACACPSAVDPL